MRTALLLLVLGHATALQVPWAAARSEGRRAVIGATAGLLFPFTLSNAASAVRSA